MFKKIFSTTPSAALAMARFTLAAVLFPHGAQKLLGWFGGYGFHGTMGFLTGGAHLPWIFALLVILIEFFGSLMILFGAGTRIAAVGIVCLFIGVIKTSHLQNGFFMNWSGKQVGEGFEFHLLIIGLALTLLIGGGGKWSVDRRLSRK
jgi:putative oxidoreductase